MKSRPLGNTGIQVSEIGLGSEYLRKESSETIQAVISKAIEHKINYFDLIWAFPHCYTNIGTVIAPHRNKVHLAFHLGSSYKGDQYVRTRKQSEIEQRFNEFKSAFDTDYADIGMIHYVAPRDYPNIVNKYRLIEYAKDLKSTGQIRAIGLSTHDPQFAIRVIEEGYLDVIMTQVNLVDYLNPHKLELLNLCMRKNVGIIAMKPFAGGKLLDRNHTVDISGYRTGGKALKHTKILKDMTPSVCLAYILAQSGISSVVPGVKNVSELMETLYFNEASSEEIEFASIAHYYRQESVKGQCVYCNHCQPCPENLDIGEILRCVDVIGNDREIPAIIQKEYQKLILKAIDCKLCGQCETRCPFDVNVQQKMKQAIKLFHS